MNKKIDIDKAVIKRRKPEDSDGEQAPQRLPPLTQGAIDRIIDLAFNPSRDKIREVTSIDRIQGKLLPQLDLVNTMWDYTIQIAEFRQDSDYYKKTYKRKQPSLPDLVSEFIYRTAQWQKSVQAMNLKSAVDLALAETEARAGEREGSIFSGFDDN